MKNTSRIVVFLLVTFLIAFPNLALPEPPYITPEHLQVTGPYEVCDTSCGDWPDCAAGLYCSSETERTLTLTATNSSICFITQIWQGTFQFGPDHFEMTNKSCTVYADTNGYYVLHAATKTTVPEGDNEEVVRCEAMCLQW